MEKNCLKQAPEKILEEGFSPDKLKKLALKFRDGESLSDIERKEFESKVIFSTFDSNWRPSWPEISGLKKCKRMNSFDPLPRGSKVVCMLWGKGAFGRDYGFFDYAVYSPSGYYKRSNRVSFRLVKMIVDGWRDDDLKKFWTPKTVNKAKDWASKMMKDSIKDVETGVFQLGDKYYTWVDVEDGVSIDRCQGMVKTKWWDRPVFETTPDDPRVVKAREEKEIEENRKRDINILRNEVVERVKKIYPEIFNETEKKIKDRIKDRYPDDERMRRPLCSKYDIYLFLLWS